MKKVVILVNILIMITIVCMLVFLIISNYPDENEIKQEECIDVNNIASFVYDLCYDAQTKNIFIEVKRARDIYNINKLNISFFDLSDRNLEVSAPEINNTKRYKIQAEKNPQNLMVSLEIKKDFSAAVCEEPRVLFVKYCAIGEQATGIEAEIKRDRGEEIFEGAVPLGGQKSDLLSLSLVEKERIWESKCKSRWVCKSWEACENNIKKRECVDENKCFISTDVPDFTSYCDNKCNENWECEWSKCTNGFSEPKCRDLNNCGTAFEKPQKLNCQDGSGCIPLILCSGWSECKTDYGFFDLIGSMQELTGIQSRTCVDKGNCINSEYQIKNCSIRTDIYTRRIKKCGKEYIAVYNRLNNELLAKIEESKIKESPYFNVYFIDDSEYCDYCFDGIKSGDEIGIDCGGGCEDCEDKYEIRYYSKERWYSGVVGWFRNLLT